MTTNNMNYLDEDRKAFEEFYTNHGQWPRGIERTSYGDYLYVATNSAWLHWRAACEWNRTKVQS